MPPNLGLAQLSNAFLVAALLSYSIAVLAFAGDFAFGRRRGSSAEGQAQSQARVPELVGAAGGQAASDPVPGGGPATPRSEAKIAAREGLPAREGKPGRWVRAALVATSAGLIAHVLGVIIRGLAVHRIPWGNMYEFITALTCVAVIFFLGLMIRYRVYYLGLFVMGAVVVALGLAQTIIYTAAGPLVPALQSYWLSIHVTAITLAVGTYFVAAVLALVYLVADRHARRVAKRERQAAGRPTSSDAIMRRLPAPEVLDSLAYRTVMFAFPIWTFGIIAGAIWADQAWGRYWGWDPTETWAFITWVVYACFLHARATVGWRGRKAQVIQLIGFGCLLFNLVGVSLFITGLHSYAGLN
ncbi:MAG TPA: c-type cytochrome biogenesis protein CcsB [Streptosporangiaceae bacterium]|jgi:cytochrome c-type biogenesis protein CcsB